MEEKSEYEHQEPNLELLFNFPLDHPKITLNKSIEDFEEFKKLMSIIEEHKESSSPLTDEGGDAMITE